MLEGVNEHFLHDEITREKPGVFFRGQFVVTLKSVPIELSPPYERKDIDRWSVYTDLPVCSMRDPSGVIVGLVLGWAFDLEGRPCRGGEISAPDLEAWLYGFGGRYIALLKVGDDWRLYLDPLGTLATVYREDDSEAGQFMIASTTSLAYVAEHRRHPVAPAPYGYYPAGMTAVGDMKRLLPNHYYSLERRAVVRHHYEKGIDRKVPSKELLEHAMFSVRSVILGAIGSTGHAYLTLTGGRDSRMMLAAAESDLTHLDLVSFSYERRRPFFVEHDQSIARSLARTLRRDITVLNAAPTSRDENIVFLWRTGAACRAGKARDFVGACQGCLSREDLLLVGFGGEVSRATNYGRARDRDLRQPDDALLVVKVKPSNDAIFAMKEWLAELNAPRNDLMELLYLEHRMACWAAPQFYGFFNLPIVPFAHRSFVDTMLSLPIDYKRSDEGAMDIIKSISLRVARIGLHNRLLNPVDRIKNRIDRMFR